MEFSSAFLGKGNSRKDSNNDCQEVIDQIGAENERTS